MGSKLRSSRAAVTIRDAVPLEIEPLLCATPVWLISLTKAARAAAYSRCAKDESTVVSAATSDGAREPAVVIVAVPQPDRRMTPAIRATRRR